MAEIRAATIRDLPGILAIYNDAVLRSTAIWNDTPVDLDNRRDWLEARRAQGYPVLVADLDGVIAGYASFGDFRPFHGYRRTVEHSIYIAERARGRGLGTRLLPELFPAALALGKNVMIGAIEAGNAASVALHRKCGFRQVGLLPGIGEKFGRPLDLLLMQRELP